MVHKYAYIRVSTTEQNEERQVTAIREYCKDIPQENIFTDKASGKNFERPEYEKMKTIIEHMSRTDGIKIELIVEELDRLGRNSDGVKEELLWFKKHNVIVRILEIQTTLVDVDENNQWALELTRNLMIDIYSSIAQHELEKRAKRQREGIAEAKKRGVYKGRKPIEVDHEAFEKVYLRWKQKEITAVQAMEQLNLKASTFYRKVKIYENESCQIAKNIKHCKG